MYYDSYGTLRKARWKKMTIRLQLLIAIISIIAMGYIANLVRVKRLELKYALVWFLVALLLLIFDLSPHLLRWLTGVLGIELPINMMFLLGFGFVLLIIFSQTIVISNLTRKSKRLTQEVGLLYKKVEDLEEQIKENQ